MKIRTPSHPGISILLLSLGLLFGCDSITYLDGHPPPDAQLAVSEVAFDTSWNSASRTVRFSFRVDWKIDSADFHLRTYRLGLVFQQTVPPWLPGPQTMPIPGPVGTARDTLSCQADTCFFMFPTVLVLAKLPTGDFLSVAHLSFLSDGSTTP